MLDLLDLSNPHQPTKRSVGNPIGDMLRQFFTLKQARAEAILRPLQWAVMIVKRIVELNHAQQFREANHPILRIVVGVVGLAGLLGAGAGGVAIFGVGGDIGTVQAE